MRARADDTPLSDEIKPYCVLSLEQFILCLKTDDFWHKTLTDELIFEYCYEKKIPIFPPSDYHKEEPDIGESELIPILEAQLNFERACQVRDQIRKKTSESKNEKTLQPELKVLEKIYSHYFEDAVSKNNLNAIYYYFVERITKHFQTATNMKSCLDGLLKIELALNEHYEHSYGVLRLLMARIYLLLVKELDRFTRENIKINNHVLNNATLFADVDNVMSEKRKKIQSYLDLAKESIVNLEKDLERMPTFMTQGVFHSQFANGCKNWDEIFKDLKNLMKFETHCATPKLES